MLQALPREDVPIREGVKIKGLNSDREEIELCIEKVLGTQMVLRLHVEGKLNINAQAF